MKFLNLDNVAMRLMITVMEKIHKITKRKVMRVVMRMKKINMRSVYHVNSRII